MEPLKVFKGKDVGFALWRDHFGSIVVTISKRRSEWKVWRLQVRIPSEK